VRGTFVYWALFLLFRFVLRRNVGAIGIADILFVVLVADAVQNSMIGDSYSVTDGVILISTFPRVHGERWNPERDFERSKMSPRLASVPLTSRYRTCP